MNVGCKPTFNNEMNVNIKFISDGDVAGVIYVVDESSPGVLSYPQN